MQRSTELREDFAILEEKPLLGKVALVTGATKGIGLAISGALGLNGARIVGVSRNPCHYELAKPILEEFGVDFKFLQGDVTDVNRIIEIAAEIKQLFGRINILVNNAGSASIRSEIKDMTVDEWRQVVDTNLSSMFYVTSSMLPLLLNKPTNESASIINVSSIAARIGTKKIAYTAAKAGVLGFTKSLAISLAKENIRVNAILPGAVSTDLTADWTESQRRNVEEKIPLGSIAEAAEIADVVLFLALPLSKYMTGQSIDANGGWVMP